MPDNETISLVDLGVVKTEGAVSQLFENLYPNILNEEYDSISAYAEQLWQKYLISPGQRQKASSGKLLEYLLAVLLYREKLLPLFLGAQVAFVPNVNFDMLLFSKECGPITLSIKTSLRERYKQADLEAVALRWVHRNAKNYLLTADPDEAALVKQKNKDGELIGGLNDIIYIFGEELDQLIVELKQYEFMEPGCVNIIQNAVGIIR